jgi:CheY-like chemotaxis protein
MSRILLVDDSPHAQRIGERILTEEGYEVVTVSNADSALIRLEDVDPDVVLADTVMPGRTGYEICQYLKMSPRHRHVRVILTAGVLEDFNEEQVQRTGADGTLKKPFEASALVAAVKPLASAAEADRAQGSGIKDQGTAAPRAAALPFVAVVDEEQVKAAVTVALDASMESMVEEIARRVVAALEKSKPATVPAAAEAATAAPAAPAGFAGLGPAPQEPKEGRVVQAEPVRKVSALRARSTSILGLDK